MATFTPTRKRFSFGRLEQVLDLPDLIDIQKRSYEWFMTEGLAETIADISPIVDYTGNLAVEFGEYSFDAPSVDIAECRETDRTFSAPLSMTVASSTATRARSASSACSWATSRYDPGRYFIINGTERVIVTQLVRSPGAYLCAPRIRTKALFTANLMPSRGSWLELEIDKKGIVYARIDRKRKLPATVLLRVLGYGRDHSILPADNTPEAEKRALDERIEDERRNGAQRILDLFGGCSTSPTRSRRTPSPRWRKASSSCSRSSARASRRRSRTRAPSCARCSSTPSATTSRASVATSSTRAWASRSTASCARSPRPIFTGSMIHNDITGWSDELGAHPPGRGHHGRPGRPRRADPQAHRRCPSTLGVPHEDSEGNPIKDYAEVARYLPMETIAAPTSTSTRTSATAACAPSAS